MNYWPPRREVRGLDEVARVKTGREVRAVDWEAEVKDVKLEILGGVVSHWNDRYKK